MQNSSFIQCKAIIRVREPKAGIKVNVKNITGVVTLNYQNFCKKCGISGSYIKEDNQMTIS